MLFITETARGVWLEHWCVRCYRNQDDCPILAKALRTDRKPVEWDRNSRPKTMAETFHCTEFSRKPPRNAPKPKQYEDVSMFDDDTLMADGRFEKRFVPVNGWPDEPTKKDTDHA